MKPQTVNISEEFYTRIEKNGEEHNAGAYGNWWESYIPGGIEVYDLLNALKLDHKHATQVTLQTETRSMFCTITKMGVDKATFSS